jgi:AraC-like DNA-binding protein
VSVPDVSTVEVADLALRGGSVMLLLLVAALLLRDHPNQTAGRLGAMFAIGTAAYALCSAPQLADQQTWWHAPLLALAAGNAVVFWLLARALFDDTFRPRAWHGALWAAFVVTALTCFFILSRRSFQVAGVIDGLHGVGRVVLASLAVTQTLRSWRADLVEERRRLRVFIVAATALYTIVEAVTHLAFWPTATPTLAAAVNAFGLAGMALIVTWSLAHVGADEVFTAAPVHTAAATTQAAGQPRNQDRTIGPPDDKLMEALHKLMALDRIYRREGLTIGALALKLGLPEYRTRRLINAHLGYRNFNAFLNSYRVAEARAALADPGQAGVPVLTIALDAGFQSLGPFNRAFKAETGLTPSEYRRRQGGLQRAPNKLTSLPKFEIGRPG